MNLYIPSYNYLLLDKQVSLENILNDFYKQINILKKHPLYNSNTINFELEFRLLTKYVNINLEEFINENCSEYQEYLFNENKNTRYRIICNSHFPANKDEEEINKNEENKGEKEEKEIQNFVDSTELCEYIRKNSDKEITNTLNNHIEYTKKVTLMSAYYLIFKVVLSIETTLDTSEIIQYLENENELENRKNRNKNTAYNYSVILQFIPPAKKKRRSFIIHKDIRIDITVCNGKSQFEIDLSRDIYHDKIDINNIIHDLIQTLDCRKFILDYLFLLLPNFEFQKPITPSFDLLFSNAEKLINNTFYVSTKTNGLRRLIIIINQMIYSISENFDVTFIKHIDFDSHIILDCEFINDIFIPFDILYYEEDLRYKNYINRITTLNSLNLNLFENTFEKKDIIECKNFSDLRNFVQEEFKKKENKIPNDGIIITDGKSNYLENNKVYKIKTENTVDLEFDGRYFYAKNCLIKKSLLNFSLSEYKKICLLYNKHKKENHTKNKNNPVAYYQKRVEFIDDEKNNIRIVHYQLVKKRRVPFIVEINIDTKTVVKDRKDKWSSNSLNTFKSILLASYQKINVDIFSLSSNIFMRKYHNIIKQNILNNYNGCLLDIGSGNGGDINKWKNFKKIVCVEPDFEKVKTLKERLLKSEIRYRISIIQNEIQNIKLKETFNVVTSFFSLNDFTYSGIYNMLKNISKNINGTFIALFYDYHLFKENIDSPSIIYKKCIEDNKFVENLIEINSPIYIISSLRYAHSECDNIMYININNSFLENHYECAIDSEKVVKIFNKFGFNLIKQYTVDESPLLNKAQIKYTKLINVIEFSNIK